MKTSKPEELPIDGPWSVSHGKHNGKVMIVRSNTGYKEVGRIPRYQHQVGLAVPLRAPEASGLPSPVEDEVKERFELLRIGIKTHEIQLMIQPDKDWGIYKQVA